LNNNNVVPGLPPKENKNEKKAAAPKETAAPAPKEEVATEAPEASKDNNRGGRPRGKDYRRGEHKNRQEGAEGEQRPRKREFDRRSGTGRGREVSRGGRGAFGAGNAEQDAKDAEKHPDEVEEVLGPVDEAAPETENAVEEQQPEPEPQPSVFTLDEYMQKREEARAKLNSIVGDKTERQVDEAQFAGLTAKNSDLGNYLPGKAKNQTATKKDQRSTGKTTLDLSFKFAAPQQEYRRERPERERGGRGGRGEGRRQKNDSPAAVFSSQDFPSL
jgi:plasminogen activator inhibitor 1 RNA-binding protein